MEPPAIWAHLESLNDPRVERTRRRKLPGRGPTTTLRRIRAAAAPSHPRARRYELDELAAILAELSQRSELPPPSVRRLTLA